MTVNNTVVIEKECQECQKCNNTIIQTSNCTKNETIPDHECPKVEECKQFPPSKECPPQLKCNTTVCPTCIKCEQCAQCPNVTSNSTCKDCELCPTIPEVICENKTCPDCPIPKDCPQQKQCIQFNQTISNCSITTSCPPVKECQSCDTSISSHYSMIIQRRNVYRVVSVAISQYIISSLFNSTTDIKITRELFMDSETHITVSAYSKTLFMVVSKIDGFENAYQVTYFINEVKYSMIVNADIQGDGSYNCVIISTYSMKIESVQQVVVYQSSESLNGFGFSSSKIEVNAVTSKIVTIFVERYSRIFNIKRELLSAVQVVSMHVHTQLKLNSNINWRVIIKEFTAIQSQFTIEGYSNDGTVITTYYAKLVEEQDHKHVYKVTIEVNQVTYTHHVIVLAYKEGFQSSIIKESKIVSSYFSIVSFRLDYFDISSSSITQPSSSIIEIHQTFSILQQSEFIYHEANVAVVALMKWVKSDLDVMLYSFQSVQTKDNEASVTVTTTQKQDGPWQVVSRRVSPQFYNLKLKYPSNNKIAYDVFVTKQSELVYDASVIVLGALRIQVSYRIQLSYIKSSNIYRVISIEIISDSLQQVQMQQFGYLKDSETSKVVKTNSTVTSQIDFSNVTSTQIEIKRETYSVYQHPTTMEEFWLFINNTVYNSVSKQVVTVDGGLQWILQYFSGSTVMQQENKFRVFNYALTQEKWKIYSDGKVFNMNDEFVTEGGIQALLKIITQRSSKQIEKSVSFVIYEVQGTDIKYKILDDGTVTTIGGDLITTGGIEGLKVFLSRSLKIVTGTAADYQIAIDQKTGIQYLVYTDGRVTSIDGSLICTTGVSCLSIYLLQDIISFNIEAEIPQYQIIHTSDGRVFYLYSSGQVTTKDGVITVQNSGLEGLKKYINKEGGMVVITVVRIERPSYREFKYNEEMYQLNVNGSIVNEQGMMIVKEGGIKGFKEWLMMIASKQSTNTVTYEIITDVNSGTNYLVYSNGTVTTQDGLYLCFSGATCLQEYLYAKSDERALSVVMVDQGFEKVKIQYTVYVDKSGKEMWIDQYGAVFNFISGTTENIFYLDKQLSDLVYNRIETYNGDIKYYIVKVESRDDRYYIYSDSSVFTIGGEFLLSGGIHALGKYLTVKSLVAVQPNNGKVHVDYLERSWNFKDNQFTDDQDQVFCRRSSILSSLNCFHVFLSTYHYTQILQAATDHSIQLYIDGNADEYSVLTSGRVLSSDGSVICDNGGVSCLYEHINSIFKDVTQVVTVRKGNEIEENIQCEHAVYVDNEQRVYYEYRNGSVKNMENGQMVEQKNASDLIKTLTFVRNQEYTQYVKYTEVTVNGLDRNDNISGLYTVRSDGSSWYKHKYFFTFGGIPAFTKYMAVKKQLRTRYEDSWIYVPQIKQSFQYVLNPDRLMDDKGNEICRAIGGFKGSYSCLISYLAENYYEKMVVDKVDMGYEVFTTGEGYQYFVYEDDRVTNSQNNLICSRGWKCLANYLRTQSRDIIFIQSQHNDLVKEQISIFVKDNDTFRVFDDGRVFNLTSNQLVEGGVALIFNRQFTFRNFSYVENIYEIITAKDVISQRVFSILSDDRVYSEDNILVSRNGVNGLRKYLQVSQSLKPVFNNDVVEFSKLNNVQFRFEELGSVVSVVDAQTGKLIIEPRGNKDEALNLLYMHLVNTELFDYTHTVFQSYSVVSDQQGFSFRIYPSGLVITNDESSQLICKTNGISCLSQYLSLNGLTFSSNPSLRKYTVYEATNEQDYAVYQNGEVVTYPGMQQVGPVGSGGVQYLVNYLNQEVVERQLEYEVYIYDGVSYHVYINGQVKFENGTVVVEKGGMNELKRIIIGVDVLESGDTYKLYKTSNSDIVYRVLITGTVIEDHSKRTICTQGGYDCLLSHLYSKAESSTVKKVLLSDGTTFFISGQGEVTISPSNEVICKKGGMECLQNWIEQSTPTQISVSGTLFNLYKNGSVIYENKTVLCISGGRSCIDQYISDNSVTLYYLNEFQFKIFGNGRVEFFNGTSLCTKGGKECVDTWFTSQLPQYFLYKQGSNLYEVYLNGSVISQSSRAIICQTGGESCLSEYLNPQYQVLVYNGVEYKHYLKSGQVVDNEGGVICENGGRQCFDQYLESIQYSVQEVSIGGVMFMFNVYDISGRVENSENGEVICENGGQQCIDEWINQKISALKSTNSMSKQELQSEGLSNQKVMSLIQEENKEIVFVSSFSWFVLMVSIAVALLTYKKRVSGQKRENEEVYNELKESLLHYEERKMIV